MFMRSHIVHVGEIFLDNCDRFIDPTATSGVVNILVGFLQISDQAKALQMMTPNMLGSSTLLLAEVTEQPSSAKKSQEPLPSTSAAVSVVSRPAEQDDDEYKWRIVWRNVLGMIYLHGGAIYGLYLLFASAQLSTFLWVPIEYSRHNDTLKSSTGLPVFLYTDGCKAQKVTKAPVIHHGSIYIYTDMTVVKIQLYSLVGQQRWALRPVHIASGHIDPIRPPGNYGSS
ncbi:Desaturase 1 [Carabus blaptoides fortunei]